MKNTICTLFDSIQRIKKDYFEFSELYSLNDLDHFDCCMFLQNFSIVINKLNKILIDNNFFEQNLVLQDFILKELNFFASIKEIIEVKRIEKSIIKIPVNTFIFSEN